MRDTILKKIATFQNHLGKNKVTSVIMVLSYSAILFTLI
jgi:hypothetical protein